MAIEEKAAAAGLVLQHEAGATRWAFAAGSASPSRFRMALPAQPDDSTAASGGVIAVETRFGLGLVAARPFAAGEVLLTDRWLVGVRMLDESGRAAAACDHCLRVCSWSPVDHSCPGCRTRYCGAACRDAAWRQHHQLLCPALAASGGLYGGGGGAQPLDVFAKHARLAPSVLQQKPEEVLLAARMLAVCTLHEGADADGPPPGGTSGSADGRAPGSSSSAASGGSASDRPRAAGVPPPFHRLCSHDAIRACALSKRAAAMVWLRDSYRLLLATPVPCSAARTRRRADARLNPLPPLSRRFCKRPSRTLGDPASAQLGRHPLFARRCPPAVYTHCLGLIEQNGASTRAVPASRLHAARAGLAAPGGAEAAGMGVYPRFSFANHCCVPNAINAKGPADGDATLDNALLLRAARPIAAGEEVTFDYLDLAHERAVGGSDGGGGEAPSASERREMLREHFGFTCECPACVPR